MSSPEREPDVDGPAPFLQAYTQEVDKIVENPCPCYPPSALFHVNPNTSDPPSSIEMLDPPIGTLQVENADEFRPYMDSSTTYRSQVSIDSHTLLLDDTIPYDLFPQFYPEGNPNPPATAKKKKKKKKKKDKPDLPDHPKPILKKWYTEGSLKPHEVTAEFLAASFFKQPREGVLGLPVEDFPVIWSDAYEGNTTSNSDTSKDLLKVGCGQCKDLLHHMLQEIGVHVDLPSSATGLKAFKAHAHTLLCIGEPDEKAIKARIEHFNPIQFQKDDGGSNTHSCCNCLVTSSAGDLELLMSKGKTRLENVQDVLSSWNQVCLLRTTVVKTSWVSPDNVYMQRTGMKLKEVYFHDQACSVPRSLRPTTSGPVVIPVSYKWLFADFCQDVFTRIRNSPNVLHPDPNHGPFCPFSLFRDPDDGLFDDRLYTPLPIWDPHQKVFESSDRLYKHFQDFKAFLIRFLWDFSRKMNASSQVTGVSSGYTYQRPGTLDPREQPHLSLGSAYLCLLGCCAEGVSPVIHPRSISYVAKNGQQGKLPYPNCVSPGFIVLPLFDTMPEERMHPSGHPYWPHMRNPDNSSVSGLDYYRQSFVKSKTARAKKEDREENSSKKEKSFSLTKAPKNLTSKSKGQANAKPPQEEEVSSEDSSDDSDDDSEAAEETSGSGIEVYIGNPSNRIHVAPGQCLYVPGHLHMGFINRPYTEKLDLRPFILLQLRSSHMACEFIPGTVVDGYMPQEMIPILNATGRDQLLKRHLPPVINALRTNLTGAKEISGTLSLKFAAIHHQHDNFVEVDVPEEESGAEQNLEKEKEDGEVEGKEVEAKEDLESGDEEEEGQKNQDPEGEEEVVEAGQKIQEETKNEEETTEDPKMTPKKQAAKQAAKSPAKQPGKRKKRLKESLVQGTPTRSSKRKKATPTHPDGEPVEVPTKKKSNKKK